ncbi:hypothetical protein BDZ91DRAFT_667399 [Kalaharituber pfeilii]|nr:hypothetical protein BDZ91DRAFT_667399 [Kalaharituber pfeilii]
MLTSSAARLSSHDDDAGHSSSSNAASSTALDSKLANEGSLGRGGEGSRVPQDNGWPSYPSSFDNPWVIHRDTIDPLADTVWWGWAILSGTWIIFVIGMGSVLGVWEWAWDHPIPTPIFLQSQKDDLALPIPGYYPALVILTMVMAWVWVVVAWVGMKYFKHAKIQPQSDDS